MSHGNTGAAGARAARRPPLYRLRLLILCVVTACGGERPPGQAEGAARLAADTAHADLSGLRANIPPPSRDTFTAPSRTGVANIPEAPRELLDAAEREEGISRFCYQEYGQKVDPKLVGAVALVVTVDANAIKAARIGAEDWSSRAGNGVMSCLVQKAPQAWKILPGVRVPSGRYVIRLRFRPS